MRWFAENNARFDFPRYGLGRESLAKMLANAQSLLPDGLFLQIIGVFRPFATQKAMYDIVKAEQREKNPHWSEEFLDSIHQRLFGAADLGHAAAAHNRRRR